jgi:hypothetical protein
MQTPRILLSQPFEIEGGEVARDFYRAGLGFGTIQTQPSRWNGKEALVTFHDRPDLELSEPVSYHRFTPNLASFERIADLHEETVAFGLTKSAIKLALSARRAEISNRYIPALDTQPQARQNLLRILTSTEFIY